MKSTAKATGRDPLHGYEHLPNSSSVLLVLDACLVQNFVLPRHAPNKKAPIKSGPLVYFCLAEEEGFEPPEPYGSTVFKTAAFDRSATPLYC